MKKLYYLSFMLLITSISYAQDKDVTAQIHYTNAEEYYNKSTLIDYDNCLYELGKAEAILGKTNSKILYLKIMAMSKFRDYYYDYDLDTCFKKFFSYDVKSIPAEKYIEVTKLKTKFRTDTSVCNPRYKASAFGRKFRADRHRNIGYIEIMRKGLKKNSEEYRRELETNIYYRFAFVWCEFLAKTGDVKAMLAVGDAYYFGEGVAKSITGLRWYKMAAELNDTTALRNLGDYYKNGFFYYGDGSEGVKDLKRAFDLYTKSEQLGGKAVYYELGKLYMPAAGLFPSSKENSEKGIEYLTKAAENGSWMAMSELKSIFEYGTKGVRRDKNLAAQWQTKYDNYFQKLKPGG